MLRWDDPANFVQGATPSVRRAWEALGIRSVGDLLETVPRRYDDYSKIATIRDAQAGEVVTLKVQVVSCQKTPGFRKRLQIIRAKFKDETGAVSATFFNQPWLPDELKAGREVFISGKVTSRPPYGKSLAHPLWEPADSPKIATGKLAPVYPLSGSLAQKTHRRLVLDALAKVETRVDPLPAETLERWSFLPSADAFRAVHEPKDLAEAERGRERLAFDELLAYQLALGLARNESQRAGAPIIRFDEPFAKRFAESLPFPLTADQKRAIWAALQDMGRDAPMRRLLQGDVGSGKTVVAAFLAAQVQRQASSAALLAPTDILARQHASTFQRLFAPHRIPLLLVTRTDKRLFVDREEQPLTNAETEERIAKGNVVLIGTHALLEAKRLPGDLALAIVDEQHRFGVAQRETLVVSARKDGRAPHFLSMTATPIPRSLTLTSYGDLDVSILREKPVGRLPITTEVCVGQSRERAYEAIRQAASRGEKAFVVCPLIDPSDALGARSATEEWKRLTEGPLKGLNVGLLHGRLKPAEKDAVMNAFAFGNGQVLVATSVIEVGVDVPKATVMAIEGAERFGLAQLHQFRGRVGRSNLPSRCFLMTDMGGEPLERLRLVARTQDGFALAEEDLKRRGSGNMFGTEQSGETGFRIAQPTDVRLMAASRELAQEWLNGDPGLNTKPAWRERVEHIRATSHLE